MYLITSGDMVLMNSLKEKIGLFGIKYNEKNAIFCF